MTETTVESLRQFTRMIEPIQTDEFVQQYFEQRPLYIRREAESHFAEVLTARDLDELFQFNAIARSILRMVKGGASIHPDNYSERGDDGAPSRISNAKVMDLFADGHTIIINSANYVFPKLERYCNDLERELRFRVQANLYVTPYTAQGFATHYDDHDVFILQVMGSKTWRIYHAPVELPSQRQRHVAGTYTLGAPQMDVTISPGDTLYIPRGFLHDASTNGTTSAHITLGLHPTRRFDLVQELTFLAQDLPAFRRSMPLSFMDRSVAAGEFKRQLVDLIDRLEVDQLIERHYLSFVDQRRFDFRDQFERLSRLNEVNLNTVVRRRSTILYVVERETGSITIRFSGNRIPIQPFLENALDTVLSGEAFAVRDIKGFLTDKARLELASQAGQGWTPRSRRVEQRLVMASTPHAPPSLRRQRVRFSRRLVESVSSFCDAVHQAVWLGLLDAERLQELTDHHYRATRKNARMT